MGVRDYWIVCCDYCQRCDHVLDVRLAKDLRALYDEAGWIVSGDLEGEDCLPSLTCPECRRFGLHLSHG